MSPLWGKTRTRGSRSWVWLILAVLFVLPLVVSSYGVSFLTQVLIYALFAASLDLLIGYLGLTSFNHATFLGVGAYSVAVLASVHPYNFWLMLLLGTIMPMLLAAIMGYFVIRNSGAYFLLITLAFNQMVFALAWKWRSLTGGDDGLPGVARPDIGWNVSMWNNEYFYYLVLIIFVIVFIVLWRLANSSFGKIITGIRESDSRMQALGYHTAAFKWITYVLAAGIAGVAGVLFVYFNGFISPQDLNWSMSGLVILMVIIGGPGTLVGPVLGAAIILFLQQLVSSYTQQWPLVTGIIFVICVLYAQEGVYGLIMKIGQRMKAFYAGFRS